MVETAFGLRIADCGLRIEPETAAGFQKVEGADDVGLDEIAGAGDGAVNVGFGGEMQNMGDAVFLDQREDGGLVAKVGFFEGVFGMMGDAFEILQMARVRQAIQIDQTPDFRAVNDVMDEVGADETGAASD
jgi:hypothetical protein